jgi:hypothetical protein
MATEALHIFDPRRNFQLQGFAGRAATTTIHDATETGVSISGIFQAAEDFAVLGWWNAYDYFNHLRLKHLPKTDLSGLKLEFDIEYDQTLDGAIRLDAATPTTCVCSITRPWSPAARLPPRSSSISTATRTWTAESTGSISTSATPGTR